MSSSIPHLALKVAVKDTLIRKITTPVTEQVSITTSLLEHKVFRILVLSILWICLWEPRSY